MPSQNLRHGLPPTAVAAASIFLALEPTLPATAAHRVTDVEFLRASRCKGLATASAADTIRLDAFLKAEGRWRTPIVLDNVQLWINFPFDDDGFA